MEIICKNCYSYNLIVFKYPFKYKWLSLKYECKDCGFVNEPITDINIIRKLKISKIRNEK